MSPMSTEELKQSLQKQLAETLAEIDRLKAEQAAQKAKKFPYNPILKAYQIPQGMTGTRLEEFFPKQAKHNWSVKAHPPTKSFHISYAKVFAQKDETHFFRIIEH